MKRVHPNLNGGDGRHVTDPSWWTCAAIPATFTVHVVTCGVGYSAGVYYPRIKEKFGESHLLTSCVGSLLLSMMAIAGILSTVIVYKVGYRASIIAGGVIAAAGFAAATVAEQLFHLYFTIGIMSGIGFGLALTPTVMVMENIFLHYPDVRDVALGIALSGTGVGVLLVPVGVYRMSQSQNWHGLMYALSGLSGLIAISGMVYKPHAGSCHKRELVRVFEVSLLKSTTFLLICLSNFTWSVGVSIIYVHLPSFAVFKGLEMFDGVMLICIIGISTFTSRSMFHSLSHSAKLDAISTTLCTVCLTVILTGLFPELFQNKAGQIGYAMMFGLHSGYWTTFVGSTASELIGDLYLAIGKGYLIFSIGLGLGIGAPLAGWVIDTYDDYNIIFYLAGSCLLFSSIVMMVLSLKGCYFRPGISNLSDLDTLSAKSFNYTKDELLISGKETAV